MSDVIAGNWQAQLHQQLKYNSVLLYDHLGNEVFAHNVEQAMVPASILKIVTADALLANLGADYRIATEFYLTEDNYLAIKGFGDPTLVSETLWQMAKQIKVYLQKKTQKKLQGFYLDNSYFAPNIKVHGLSDSNNPYDASLAALAVNYNTINVFKSPQGKLSSAEQQTPLTATAIALAKKLPAGKHRINLGQQPDIAAQYFAQLLQLFLLKEGIDIALDIKLNAIPEGAKKIYTHYSDTLDNIIQSMFRYSNNFIANQLFVILGAEKIAAPANMDKGRQVVTDFLHQSIGIKKFILEEGSGLSRRNLISAKEMMAVLLHFKPYYQLLRHYNKRFRAKTGTLKGVSTFAGYMVSPKGNYFPFVIMLSHSDISSRRQVIANSLYKNIFQGY